MGGGGRVVDAGEFGACREPQPARHRRDAIAILEVEHGARDPGVAARGVVHVIAALDEERQPVAEPAGEFARPWPQRDDRLAGLRQPLLGDHAPAAVGGFKGVGLARREPAAALDEQREIGLREGCRV
jgi:hypothetical protein